MVEAVFPLCFLPGANSGGGNEDNGDLLQKVPSCTATLSAPSPAAGHRLPMPLLENPGHS